MRACILTVYFPQEKAHTRLMKERDVDEERKRKNTQVRRSASIYGDNKYVHFVCTHERVEVNIFHDFF